MLDVFRLFPAGTPDDYGTLVPLTAEQVKGAVCAEKSSREIAYAEDSVEHRSGCGHPTMQRPLYPLSGRHPSVPGRLGVSAD